MNTSREQPPAPARNLFALLMASVALTFVILTGAETLGANELKKEVTTQEQWNAENKATADARKAARLKLASQGETSSLRYAELAPEALLAKHDTLPTDKMREEYHSKNNRSRDEGIIGGLAFFLMGGSLTSRQFAKKREAMRLAALPKPIIPEYESRGAIADGKDATLTITVVPEAKKSRRARRAERKRSRPTYFNPDISLARPAGFANTRGDQPATTTITLPTKIRVSPIPPPEEINPAYVRRFEPQVYTALNNPPIVEELAEQDPFFALDQLMGPPQLSRVERFVHLHRSIIHAQLAAAGPVDPLSTISYEPLPPLDSPVLVGAGPATQQPLMPCLN